MEDTVAFWRLVCALGSYYIRIKEVITRSLRHEQQSVKAATPSRNLIELDLHACFKRLQRHSLQFVTWERQHQYMIIGYLNP